MSDVQARSTTRPRVEPGRIVLRGLRRALVLVDVMHRRRRGRRQLWSLDDHLLRDVGISRPEAERESRKPYWRA